jgi:signal transduction histidine kinase
VGEARRSFRIAVGLAVAALALVQVHALVQIFRSQPRMQERMVRTARESFLAVRPRVQAALVPGGPEAWHEAARVMAASSSAAEIDFFDPGGARLYSTPTVSPVPHWPGRELIESLTPGAAVMTFGPFTGPAPRILTYAAFPSGERTVIVRLSSPASDLIEDLRERRQLLVGHGIALVILAVLGGMTLLPPPRDPGEGVSPQALGAYEEAMGRLRDHGEALSREHEAERRRMEGEIRESQAMARAGELTAGIVHEVRNGLGTILGYARLLERDESSPAATDAARGIREECETLEIVVRRFMEFVKHETVNVATFDLGRMLSRVVARESRHRSAAVVRVDGADELPPFEGDEELLERAFENLVRNALEAAGPRGQVKVYALRDDAAVAVVIEDNGPGIGGKSEDGLKPFYSTKAGGLGLGLPIAYKIVRLHRGDLRLEDREPKGVRVTVRLPQPSRSA